MLKILFLAYEDFTASHLELSEVPLFPGSLGALTETFETIFFFFKADLLVIKKTQQCFLTSFANSLLKILYNDDNINIQAILSL